MTNEQIIHSVLIILVCATVTYLLRGIAFLVFGGKRGTPAFISWLGGVLPHAVMGMLLVYCLKDTHGKLPKNSDKAGAGMQAPHRIHPIARPLSRSR